MGDITVAVTYMAIRPILNYSVKGISFRLQGLTPLGWIDICPPSLLSIDQTLLAVTHKPQVNAGPPLDPSLTKKVVDTHIALTFFRAVGCSPFHSVVTRRGKTYNMWSNIHSHRKIISVAQLEQMNLYELVCWMRPRYPLAKVLFPNPDVYKEN